MPGEQQVRITLFQPNIAPTKVTVGAQMQTITLGRASDCTIPIKDRFLSRRHAEIMFDAGQWLVRDCGSVGSIGRAEALGLLSEAISAKSTPGKV